MPDLVHEDCVAYLRNEMAALGVDATVSAVPPIVKSPYEEAAFTCPHGTTFWMEPTGEQIAQWAKDGVA